MDSVQLIDSDAWLSIVKDRPDLPELQTGDTIELQNYVADMFEWTFSISLATQGLTSDKAVSDKIAQNLSR